MMEIPYEVVTLALGAACYMLHKVVMTKRVVKKTVAEHDIQAFEPGHDFASPVPCSEPDSEPMPTTEEYLDSQHAAESAVHARQKGLPLGIWRRPAAIIITCTIVFLGLLLTRHPTCYLSESTASSRPVAHSLSPSADEMIIPDLPEAPELVFEEAPQVLEDAPADSGGKQNIYEVPLTRHSFPVSSVGDVVYHRSAYYGTVHVGSPPVPFKVVFDTGSGHLILPSTYCPSETCRVHRRYRRSASATAMDIDYDGTRVLPGQPRDQITVSFGTGEVTGVFIEDVVCMNGDLSMGQQALASQQAPHQVSIPSSNTSIDKDDLPNGCIKLRLIAATQMSEEPFKGFAFDGVLGLGLDALSQAPAFNFLEVVANSARSFGGGDKPHTFAVFLADDSSEESKITFGGWDEDSLMEDLSWNPVVEPEQGHWTIRIKQVRVDDEVVDLCNSGCKGVVDTGTSLLAVPAVAFSELYTLMRHPAHLEGHCYGPGPQLHIELEHFTITLDPEDYARLERSPPKRTRPRFEAKKPDAPLTRSDMHCKPMLMSMDLPPPLGPKLFILGEPILRKFYSVYDGKKQRVGFARAKHHQFTPALRKDVNGNLYSPSPRSEPEFRSMFDVFRWRKLRKSGRSESM